MVSFHGTYWLSSACFMIGVVPRFLSGVSRGELLQPYSVINVTGLVQFGENLNYILPPLVTHNYLQLLVRVSP